MASTENGYCCLVPRHEPTLPFGEKPKFTRGVMVPNDYYFDGIIEHEYELVRGKMEPIEDEL